MTLKQKFEAYTEKMASVAWNEKKLREMSKVTDTVRGSESEPPYLPRVFKISGADEQKVKRIREWIADAKQCMADVEEAIEDVQDMTIKRALEVKYIDGCSWEEVANCVGAKSGEAIRKKIERYFEKICKSVRFVRTVRVDMW